MLKFLGNVLLAAGAAAAMLGVALLFANTAIDPSGLILSSLGLATLSIPAGVLCWWRVHEF